VSSSPWWWPKKLKPQRSTTYSRMSWASKRPCLCPTCSMQKASLILMGSHPWAFTYSTSSCTRTPMTNPTSSSTPETIPQDVCRIHTLPEQRHPPAWGLEFSHYRIKWIPEVAINCVYNNTTTNLGASDGSVKFENGTLGWALSSPTGEELIKCKRPAYGIVMDSYHAEAYGLLSITTLVTLLCNRQQIPLLPLNTYATMMH
jgi:hypothetical protein